MTQAGATRAFLIRMVASGFFISLLPSLVIKYKKNTGAGFMGTLLAAATVPLLPEDRFAYAVFLIAFTVFAVWISDRADFGSGQDDDPRIVIDEVAGYYFAIAFLPRTPLLLLLCFILFRTCDTIKPFGIKKLDAIHNGFGITMDDVASGIAVNAVVWLGYRIFSL
ncbi:MAG: phosphatidylglycerophosphatase A [Elusimicrobiaceae bacterium]|jgi:phosphatidylglycerophosphatase A